MKQLLLVVALLVVAFPARAEQRTASFALIIGVNRGADPELPELRYADDDAARYQELFRLLGARTYLHARLDANTRRLHVQAAAEARLPRRAELARSLKELRAEVRQAKRRGVRVALYVVYAGHGNVKNGEAYVLLENDRWNARRLAELVERPGADEVHLIVDACNSGLLAASRGPGGRRRPFAGFSQMGPLVENPRVGLLLSTSSGRESHEWERFQAGVFSHEVRSGLYGAADADHDGRVSYREIAAFVDRANAAIPNERFRPDVLARPPAGSDSLVSLQVGLGRRVEVRTRQGSHWVLENGVGVRVADFHPGPDHEMSIVRPGNELLFLRRVPEKTDSAEEEYALPTGTDVVQLADLEAAIPRVAMRGAAHESFSLIFSLPFDLATVKAHERPSREHARPVASPRTDHVSDWRRPTGITALGVGAALAATGAALWLSGETIRRDGESGVSQRDLAVRNQRVTDRRTASFVTLGFAGVATAAGLILLAWPASSPR